MKNFTLLLLLCLVQLIIQAQNIGVNSTGEKPDNSAMLDVKSTTGGFLPPRMTYNQMIAISAPAPGLIVYVTSDEPGLHVFDGSFWRLVRAAGGNDNFWYSPIANTIVSPELTSVGIYTTSATNHLQVGSNGGFNGNDFVVGNGADAFALTEYNGSTFFETTNNMIINAGQSSPYVGIHTNTPPTNFLQIGNSSGYTDYDFVVTRNNQSMALYQGPNFTNWTATDNISINPKAGAGYVGINVGSNPANKLQIGSVGNTGFATNDLAIGNGTNAMAIYQTDLATTVGSTTDIILMPRNNGHGRVGINTATPRAPLDVVDDVVVNVPNNEYSYMNLLTGVDDNGVVFSCDHCYPDASIYASNYIVASEFDAYSDSRIKNIIGTSDAVHDLATINALQIKDYTMKDKIKYGNKRFKKVIAQEVEQVYPLAVSKHTDFIPNVYRTATVVEKSANEWLLAFNGNHGLSPGAKKIRVLIPENSGWQEVDIISIPSDSQVVVKSQDIHSKRLFVYGEQVDDFRTVDYEAISTLNVSATQELSKTIKAQQILIAQQQAVLKKLERRIAVLENKKTHDNRLNNLQKDLSKN